MSVELLDDDGYPTDEALARIEKWSTDDGRLPWFEFIRSIWQYRDFGYWHEEDGENDFKRKVRRFYVSTAGWSGNESIIAAMRKNRLLWMFTWVQHRRGGHYIFEVEL